MTRTRWRPPPIRLLSSLLLLLLLCTCTWAKPMVGQPPKDIACPSDRIFGAVGSGDDSTRREWLKVEVEATSLHACIAACYGYRYCYSVSFDPRLSTRPCVFYLHTSANCAARKLKPIGQLSAADSSVFVECLKCATEEEALRDSSPLGVDYVKKTDLAGTKILFHTDGESDGEHAEEELDLDESLANFKFKAFKECEGEIVFRKAGERVTRELLHSLANSTLAGSSANCARACYSAENCKRAIYIPSSGMCAFDANEKKGDSADCRLQTPELTSLPTPEAAFLECIRCRKSKLANQYEGKSNDSPMGSGLLVSDNAVYARACTVTFQVAHDLSSLGFQPDQEATVASLNECAFICYQNSCTGAIYEPPTGTSNAAKCRIAVRQRENCSGALQNHYSFNSHTTVALSCFRCVPNRPTTLSPDAEIITSTISSLSPQQPEITEVQKGGKPQTDVESTIQLVHLKHGCSIAFQAESPDKRPKEFQSTFDTSLVVETADLCATRCYQDGCTGALFLPEQKLCKLGYGDRHSCSYGPLITHFAPANPSDQVWIHCVSCQTNLKNPKEVTLSRVTGGESTATPSPVAVGRDESRPATSESPGEYEASTTPAAGTVQPLEAPTTAEGEEKPASSPQPQETTAEVSRVTSTPGQLPPEAETEAPEGTSERPASSAEFATTQQPQEAPRGSTVPTDDLIPAEGVITTGEPREETSGAEQNEAATTILPVEASEQPVPTTQPSVEKLLTTAEQEIEKAAATASSILNEAVSKAQEAIEKAGDELKGTTHEPQQETTLVVGVTTAQPEASSGGPVEETAPTLKPVIAEQAEGQTGQEEATTIFPLQTTQSDAERLLTTAQEAIESAASTAASVLEEGASTAQEAIRKAGEQLDATTSEPQDGGSSAVPLPTTLPADGQTVLVTNAPPSTPEPSEESVATSKPIVGLQQEGQTGGAEATTILPVQTTQSDAEKLLTTAQEEIEKAASTAASVIDEGVSTAKAAIQEAGQELKATTGEPQEGSTLVVGVTSGAPQSTNEAVQQTTPVLAELVTSQPANPEATTIGSVPAEQQEETVATGQPAGTSESPQEATSGIPPAAPGEVVVVQTTQLPLETTQPSVEKLLTTAEQEIEKAASTAASILNEAVSKAQEAIEKAGDELKGTTSEPQEGESTLQGTTVLITNAPPITSGPAESTPAEVGEPVATSKPVVGLQQEGQTDEQEATTPELEASTGPTVSERPAAELGEKGPKEASVETTPELPSTTPLSVEQPPATSALPAESTPSDAERLLTTAQQEIENAASTAASILDEGASTAQVALEKAGDLLKSTTSGPEEPSTNGKVEIAVTTPEPQATTFEGSGTTILETVATAKPAGGLEQQGGRTEDLQTTPEVQATTLQPEQPAQTTQSDAERLLTTAEQEIREAASTAASVIDEAASTAQASIEKAGELLKGTTSQPEESTLLVGLTTQSTESSRRTDAEATSGESATELPKTTIATEELLPQSVGRVEPTATSAPPEDEQPTSRTEEIESSTPSGGSETITLRPVGEPETTILPVESSTSEGPQSTTPNSVEKALNSAAEILQEAKENATNIINEAVTKAQAALEKVEDKIEGTTPMPSSEPAESTPASLGETSGSSKPVVGGQEEAGTTILPVETTPSEAERLLTTAEQEIREAASTAASILDEAASTAQASIEKAGELLKSTTSEPERSTALPLATSSPSESGTLLVTDLAPSTPEPSEESVATPKPVIGLQQESQTSQAAATTIIPPASTPSEAERLLSTAEQEIEKAASTAASVLEEGASTAKEEIQKAGDELKGSTAQPAEQQETTLESATSSDNLATKEEQQTTPVVVVEVTSERPSSSELPVGGSTIPEAAATSGEEATTILPASSTPSEAERLLSTAEQEIREAASTAASVLDEGASTAQASLEKAGDILKGTTSEPAESETSSRPSESPIVVGLTTAQPEASSGAPVDETAATSKPVVGLQQEGRTGELQTTTLVPELPDQTTQSDAEKLLSTAEQEVREAASTAANIIDEAASTAQASIEKARDELQATTISPEGSTGSENEPQATSIASETPASPASTPSTEELLPKEREPVFLTTSQPAESTGGQERATTLPTSGEEGDSSELQTASTVRIWGTQAPVQEETTSERVQETTQLPVTSAPSEDQQPTTEEPEESSGSTVEQRAQTVLILGTPAAPQNKEGGTTGAPSTSSGEENTTPSVQEQAGGETTNLPAESSTSEGPQSTTPNSVEKALNSAAEILQEAKENATNIINEAVTKAQAALEKIEDKIEGTTPMPTSEPAESTPAEVGEPAVTSRPGVGLQQEGQTGEQEPTTPELEASTGPTVSERPAAKLGEKGQKEASVETTLELPSTTPLSVEQPPATSALPAESTPSDAERLLTTAQQEIENAASTAASVLDEGASTAQVAIQKAGDLLKSTTSQPEGSTLLIGLTTQQAESSEGPESTTVESVVAGVASESTGEQKATTILPPSPVVLETSATSKPVIGLQQEGQTGEAEATTILPLQTTQTDAEKLLSTAEQEIREAASTAASVLDEGASTAQASLEKAGELLKGSTSEPAEGETSAPPPATSSPSESETLLITNAPPTTPEGPLSSGAPVEETARTAKPVVGLQQEGQTGRVEATTILPEKPAETTQSDAEKHLSSAQEAIENAASTAASVIDEAASTAQASIEKAGELLKGTTSEPQEGSTIVIGVTTGSPESTNEVEVTTGPSQRETTLFGVPVTSAGLPESSTLLITNAPPTSADESASTPLVKVADESALPTESSANVLSTTEGEEATTPSAEASSLPPIKSEVSSAIPPLTNQPEVATTLPPIGGQSTAIVQESGSTQEPKEGEGLTTIFPQSGTSEAAEQSTIAVVAEATSESSGERKTTTIQPSSPVVLETSATSKPIVGLQQEGATGQAEATTILPLESTPSEAERLLTTAEQEIREAASTAASVIDEAASTAQASIEKAGDLLKGTTSEPTERGESTDLPSESGTILITNAPPTTGLPVEETAATSKPVIGLQQEGQTGEAEGTTILPLQTTPSDAEKVLSTAEQKLEEAASTAASVIQEGASTAKEAIQQAGELLKPTTSEPQEESTVIIGVTSGAPESTNEAEGRTTPFPAKLETSESAIPEATTSASVPIGQQEGEASTSIPPASTLPDEAATRKIVVVQTTELPPETTPSDAGRLLSTAQQEISEAASTAASIIDEAASTAQSAIQKAGDLVKGSTNELQERQTTGLPAESETILITNAPPTSALPVEETVATLKPVVGLQQEGRTGAEEPATTILPLGTTPSDAEKLLSTAEQNVKDAASTAASVLDEGASTAAAAIQKAGDLLKSSTSEPQEATTQLPEATTIPAESGTVLITNAPPTTVESSATSEENGETSATLKPVIGLQQEGSTGRVLETTVVPLESSEQPTSGAGEEASTAVPSVEENEDRKTILPAEEPISSTQPSVEKLLTTAEQEIEKAAATASSILNQAVSKAQVAIEKAGDELKGTTSEPQQETSAPPLPTSQVTIEEPVVTLKPSADLQQEGQTRGVEATTGQPEESSALPAKEGLVSTEAPVQTTGQPEKPLATTQSESEKLLITAQEEIEKAASTAASVLEEGASTAQEAIQKAGDLLKMTESPLAQTTLQEVTGTTLLETVITAKPPSSLESAGGTKEAEQTTPAGQQSTGAESESAGSGFATATQENEPATTLGAILETSTPLHGLEIAKTNTEELLPPGTTGGSSAETSEQPTTQTVISNELQSTTAEPPSGSSTTLPDIVRAVSELVDAIGRNKNNSATTPEPPVEAVSQLVQTLSKHGDVDGILRGDKQGGFGNKGCAGSIQFSGTVLTDYAQPFEMILASDTIKECARVCYDLGCTRAAFTRFPRPACLLHFEEHELKLTQRCSSNERLNSTWRFTRNEEAVQLLCVKCGENIQKDEGSNEVATPDEEVKQSGVPKQGYTNVCNGRVEFHIAAVASLPKLNVTNDVQSDSPADCARKCLEQEGCTTAGFVPISSSATGGGVCLMTSDVTECLDDVDYHPQHASTVPFVLSCIKCSKCDYALSAVTPNTPLLVKFDRVITVRSLAECAERCAAENCGRAQFDPTNLSCSMISAVHRRVRATDACPPERAVDTSSIFPVLLDCVQCSE